MRLPVRLSLIFSLLVLAAGCAPARQTAPLPATATSIPAPTSQPPTPTVIPEPTQPAAEPTPAPVERQPLGGQVNVASLNHRSGPGILFEVLGIYPQDTPVTALGAVPGYDWLLVEDESGEQGWVFTDLITLEGDLQTLPLLEAAESQQITGKVIDSSGQAIEGVQVQITAILFDTAVQFATRSGADGGFFAYFPADTAGLWLVEIIGTDCDSRIVDGNCNVVDYFLYNSSAFVQLPVASPVVFVYEQSTADIFGTVQDASGAPVSSIRVLAERSDGATASAISSTTGSFALPVSPGGWEVYAAQFNPLLEGERLRVEVPQSGRVDDVVIQAPVEEEEEEAEG